MITLSDIKTILYKEAVIALGDQMMITKDKAAPTLHEPSERVVVVGNATDNADPWQRAYVRLLVFIPDVRSSEDGQTSFLEPDNARLTQVERILVTAFSRSTYGEFGGVGYLFAIEDTGIEEDEPTKSHFLNIRVKFEITNFKQL